MSDASGRRRTGRLVRAGDRAAGAVITLGGLAVLGSMLAICVFLVSSAAPLFAGGSAEREAAAAVRLGASPAGSVVFDPTGRQAVLVTPDGRAAAFDTQSGAVWGSVSLLAEAAEASVLSVSPSTGEVTAGFGGGAISGGAVRAVPVLVAGDRAGPVGTLSLVSGEAAEALVRAARFEDAADRAVAVEAAEGGARVWELAVVRAEPSELGEGLAPVVAIAGRQVSSRERVTVAVLADGSAFVASSRSVRRLDGRPGRARVTVKPVEVDATAGTRPPGWVFLVGASGDVVMLWADGRYRRYVDGGGDAYVFAQGGRVLDEGRSVTAAAAALGGNSLLIGDDSGAVSAWRLAERAGETGEIQRRMTRSVSIDVGEAPVRSIGVGRRDRTVAIGLADGTLVLENMTSGKRVASWTGEGGAVVAAGVSPAVDAAVGVFEDGTVRVWRLDPGHPEATWSSLFGRVPYEGYDGPSFVYQSTGSPGSEAKLSLVPLVWGTLKATVVAMLFAVPLAVLGAVYTSEFLHPSWRRTVKPTIELMASLPSVVLGFIAAMLVAPLIAAWLPRVILSMGVVPIAVLVGAGVWRMVPPDARRRVPTAVLTGLVVGVMLAGVGVATLAGGVLDRALFGSGDTGASGLRVWLDSGAGSAWPGWFMALAGPGAAGVLAAWWWLGVSRWNAFTDGMPRVRAGVAQLALLAAQVAAALAVSAIGAWALTGVGLDPRDSIFGPFSQRNTLVVGLIMGVAVIPIIYTIADDALIAVPRSLRFASTGCGATAWQTAVRVVLPVAGSGIFSACMIGLGRAVGETMIVLMATGNTPEISMNIFGGFRTLAANIAVELPEAPRGGTHYRVLFLCGLVLFVMTLVINTTAELVRQRFRRRNAAL